MTHLVGKTLRTAVFSVSAVLLLAVSAFAAEDGIAVAIGATTGSSLRLRSEPSLSASVITMLDEDVPVAVLDNTLDGWYKINYNGNTGFVSADYMLIDQDNIFDAYGRVEGDGVNVRASASTDSEALTVMNRNSMRTAGTRSPPTAWTAISAAIISPCAVPAPAPPDLSAVPPAMW